MNEGRKEGRKEGKKEGREERKKERKKEGKKHAKKQTKNKKKVISAFLYKFRLTNLVKGCVATCNLIYTECAWKDRIVPSFFFLIIIQ